jgi:hypothetical protein
MPGDASLLGILGGDNRTNDALEQGIHKINSVAMERWHARHECAMRRLYADADQYLPERTLPDYRNRSLSQHYGDESVVGNHNTSSFDWTQPLEMELDAQSLPDGSDAESLSNVASKMFVMRDDFPGFELAWVARRVDSAGAGRPVLFLEQHKLQRSTRPQSLFDVIDNLRNALKEARKANWNPQDVVFVVKATREMDVALVTAVDVRNFVTDAAVEDKLSQKESFRKLSREEQDQRVAERKAELLEAWESTTKVFLCGKDGLGKYLGSMLWSALTAGEALGPAVSFQDGHSVISGSGSDGEK